VETRNGISALLISEAGSGGEGSRDGVWGKRERKGSRRGCCAGTHSRDPVSRTGFFDASPRREFKVRSGVRSPWRIRRGIFISFKKREKEEGGKWEGKKKDRPLSIVATESTVAPFRVSFAHECDPQDFAWHDCETVAY